MPTETEIGTGKSLELDRHLAPQALGHGQRVALADPAQHQRELLAAEADRRVVLARAGAQEVGEAAQDDVAGRVAERVVDALEVVEVADDERQRAAPAVEPVLEAAAVAQAGQRVELGEVAHLRERAGGLDRADGVVGEGAQRAQLVDPRQQQVDRVVGPQEAQQRAGAVAQRDHQPVVVPRVRAAAVVARGVDGRHARLGGQRARRLGVEQHAALLDELGRDHALDGAGREAAEARDEVEAHAGGGQQPPVARLVEEDAGQLEAERVADPLAHGAQHLAARAARGQLGRDAQQVLDRGAVARRLGRELGVLDDARHERRHGGQDLERRVGRAAAVERLVEREEGEPAAVGGGERDEQRVVGVPGVRPLAGHAAGHPRHVQALEVELVVRHQEGAVTAEALVEQLVELGGLDPPAEQLLPRLLVLILGDHDLVVVPGRAVQVHHDGRVAQLLGHGGGGRLEQPRQVVAGADDGGHVEQGAQAGEGAGRVAGGGTGADTL